MVNHFWLMENGGERPTTFNGQHFVPYYIKNSYERQCSLQLHTDLSHIFLAKISNRRYKKCLQQGREDTSWQQMKKPEF